MGLRVGALNFKAFGHLSCEIWGPLGKAIASFCSGPWTWVFGSKAWGFGGRRLSLSSAFGLRFPQAESTVAKV